MAFVPAIIAGVGALAQADAARNAGKFNATMDLNEQKIATDQATAQENLQRRSSREILGREVAAFGAAGTGYGGSAEGALNQSAVNQEIDALNTRYRGAVTGYGYGVRSSVDRSVAGTMAGSALLRGAANVYGALPSSGLGGPGT